MKLLYRLVSSFLNYYEINQTNSKTTSSMFESNKMFFQKNDTLENRSKVSDRLVILREEKLIYIPHCAQFLKYKLIFI